MTLFVFGSKLLPFRNGDTVSEGKKPKNDAHPVTRFYNTFSVY